MKKGMIEEKLCNVANVLRRDVAQMTTAAGSGHPSSCFSCAEIISTLFFHEMNYDTKNPSNPSNDEFILSKGHAAPIYYAALKRAGAIEDDLMKLRKLSSNLEGHPMPRSLKWAKVATGSLGQGMSIGVGTALAGKILGSLFRTFVLLGDSEMAEGSNYEAMQIAAHYKLSNLIVIVDVNRLGQRGETMYGWDTQSYKKKFEAFGWSVNILDGHRVKDIIEAIEYKRTRDKPLAIIAKTVKGKGVSFMENKDGWHGRALNTEELKIALKEIPNVKMPNITIEKPEFVGSSYLIHTKKNKIELTPYRKAELVSTREAYGKAIAEIVRKDEKTIILDSEVSNSTFAEEAKKVRIEQFVECYIAEQNMVGMCLGLCKRGLIVFGSTFAAFLSRAHDQIRMSALSGGNFTLCGSHAGVSIGEDGASQMGLEDIAIFRTLPDSVVLYPCDGVSAEKLTHLAAKTNGLKYIRTTRGKTPVLYGPEEKFDLGDFKILHSGTKDKVVLVGAGVTLHENLKAHEILEKRRIQSAVVDLYCVKPFDSRKFIAFVKKHGGRVVVAEDHYNEGGIGEMLSAAVANEKIAIERLSVGERPHSGKPEELLKKYGIDAEAIVSAAERLLKI